MNLQSVIAGLGGIARTHQLLETHSPGQIRASVQRGEIARLRKGVYAVKFNDPSAQAARHGGQLSCISLLRSRGIWILSDDNRVHIDVGRNGRRHHTNAAALRVHNTSTPTELKAASVAHALILAARCLSEESLFAAFESAWNRGLISRENRAWVRQNVPPRLRRLLHRARGDAESGLESLVRLRLTLLGFEVMSQVRIRTVGRVDLVIGKVIIETDGEDGHADPASRLKDLQRDRAAIALGYRPMRLTYAMVVHDWPETERAILAAIAAA